MSLKNKSFKKLITQNLLFSLSFTLIAIITVVLVIHVVTLYNTLKDYNRTSSELLTVFLDNQISEATRDLSFLKKMITKSNPDIDFYINSFIKQYKNYAAVWIADSNGITAKIYPENKYLEGTDKSGSDVYIEIVKKKKSISLSSIFLASETNLPSFDIAIPMGSGLLAATITSTIFNSEMMNLGKEKDHFITLTDRHAAWLSHINIKKVKMRETDNDFSKYSHLTSDESMDFVSAQDGKYYYRYVQALHSTGWYLSVFHPIKEIYLPVLILLAIILVISIPILIISYSASYGVIKKIFIPMDNFVLATEKIGEGDYHYKIPATGYNEFDHVRESLIKMVENIDQREKDQKELWLQLLQSQKMEAIGSLASGVAHDFNNLLTAIGGYSDIISINFEESSKEMAYIGEVNKAIDRATALTRQLLAFSRKDSFKKESVCFKNLVEGIIKMLHRIVGEDIKIEVSIEDDLPKISADPHQFEQILLNLTVNSRDALLESKTTDPTIRFETKGVVDDVANLKPYVKIELSDNGPGIPEGIRDHIFESFFTTKEKGKGTGLGLSTVKGIINQNDAIINVGDSENGGALFTILWPVDTEEAILKENSKEKKMANIERKRILYVDDEKILCEIASEMLVKMNHYVEVAYDGEEALELLNNNNGHFDLIITDVIMPKLGGPELIKKVHDTWPGIKVIFVTGYVDDRIETSGIDVSAENFIRKPFNMIDLKNAIHNIFK